MVIILIAVYVASILVGTLVVGTCLFLVEDRYESSFAKGAALKTWGKCAAIVGVMTLFGLIPYVGWILALVAFFVAVMFFFEKTFVQAFLLSVVIGLFSGAVGWLIDRIQFAMQA